MTIEEFKKLPQKDRTYVLKGEASPLAFMFNCRHSKGNELLYFDKEKQINRAIRYAKNQKSPFVDEQDDNFVLEHVVFTDGKLEVPKENPVLQLILSVLHPKLGSIYKELDFEQMAKDEISQMDIEDNARELASKLDHETAVSILRVHTTSNVDEMTVGEIKRDIRIFARLYPTEFIASIDDPDLKVLNVANRMLQQGKVVVKNGKDIHFSLLNNNRKIITIPFGETPVDALCKYLVTDKGIEVFNIMTKES